MKSLYEYYIKPSPPIIDGHIHMFNWEKNICNDVPISLNPEYKRVVFIDIEFDNIDKYNFFNRYHQYIKSGYKKDTDILLASGITIEDIEKIYNRYPKTIKGFGELKCYNKYLGEKIDYKKISFVEQVCDFSKNHGSKPVYIHWEFENDSDVKKLERIIKSYPSVPIVLCHCGMNESNQDFAYHQSVRMSKIYDNLWLDISYTALDFFYDNVLLLNNLPPDKVFTGTDINCKSLGPSHDFKNDYNNIIDKICTVNKYINSDKNIKLLFKDSFK